MFNLNFDFINDIKRNFFPFYKNKELKLVFKILQQGFPKDKITSRFVGGCVRKHLSNEKIDDIDIATILTTDEIQERFKNTKFKVIETGLKHGTLTIITDNHKLEITTLRKDVKTDGRHAEIEYTDDWQLDSERRDFTINSIYIDINGKIFDPQQGTTDLKNNVVKFIGDPQKRIEEDYLRIIRFIRFKLMYNIEVEKNTSDAIKQNLDGIRKIAKERILQELIKILNLKSFLQINQSNYLKEIFLMIFPELLYLKRLERLKKVYDYSEKNLDILLAVLLIDDKDNQEYFSHKYNVSNKVKDSLDNFAKNILLLKKNKNFFDKDLRQNLYKYGKGHVISLNLINFTLREKISTQDFSKNLKRILKTNVPKFHINGEYLKKKGMHEGVSLGKVLKIIENEWLKNDFKISDERVKELVKNDFN